MASKSNKRMQSKEFGLLPLPPIRNPFGSSRGATTEIMWLPLVPQPINVGTTSYAAALNITAASIQNFSSYAAVWEEYIIRAIEWEIISGGTQVGFLKLYVDEADNSSPTATTAKAHFGLIVPCQGSTGYRTKVRWVAKDTSDEKFSSVNVTNTFITALKIYSNTADYGLTGTAETVALVNAHACVQFRTQGGA